MISILLFIILFTFSFALFGINIKKLINKINIGKLNKINDNKSVRWKKTILIALGQKKMFDRPVAGIFHLFIYTAFILTQIEFIEIIIDGISNGHRFFYDKLGFLYTFLISFIEILSLLAFFSTLIFLSRRNLLKLPRFHKNEMNGWPKLDGNIILYLEFTLIIFIFLMNIADESIIRNNNNSYGFALSSMFYPIFAGIEIHTLHLLERIGWWGHIIVVLIFMNYLPYSKHFHIFLAFPNVFYSKIENRAKISNLESVTKEVKAMLDPNNDPFASTENSEIPTFGVKDVDDLAWNQLLMAYSCTECGRCTDNCPANKTGKLLSPRKIMMDIRDRTDELYNAKDDKAKNNLLINNYITEEEIWACTTCNACTDACPIEIDPLSIIVDLRRYLVMEQSSMPNELMMMNTNIENNAAPWQFSQNNRLNWANED